MKQSKFLLKPASVLLAFCLLAAVIFPHNVALVSGAESGENLSLEEQQATLEQKLKEINGKLDSLSQQSEETEDYIDALDEKIGYLKQELSLSQQQIDGSKAEIENLKKQYEKNEEDIASLQTQIKDMTQQSKTLRKEFDNTFDEYGERARALYISGNTTVLEMLLTCDDISSFLTRLEMIKRVAVSDKSLLEKLQSKGEKILALKDEMVSKENSLTESQKTLQKNQDALEQGIKDLEAMQASYQDKQSLYESEKKQSDQLLLKLHQQTQTYSEYRNADLADLEEINEEIEAAAEKYKQELEAQTTTTTAPSTTNSASDNSEDNSNTTSTTSTTKPATTQSSGKLSMTYPVPSQTNITTAYGSAGYAGHTGVDFACPSNSKVVAAESGIVIISKDITSHSNCSCSYTGGGYHSYGRYIVIMHDKKNSSGDYVYTLYAHNSSRVVEEGQRVSKGQLIAYSGSTGNSTGPHCHFEVRTPGSGYECCVNPTPYLP